MGRFFAEMKSVLERHGGVVEKFIGDAVMAVFGIPVLHEDDALRAVRAASEMRERLVVVNQDLERDFGVRIEVRTGINTGEVVAGDPAGAQTLVTGDAVNVAARLEQAAPPGEILLGEQTYLLVKDAVQASPVEPLELKGKAARVTAYRLTGVLAGAPAVTGLTGTPFVGREPELERLRVEFELAAGERCCRLVTVLGAPGIGKSRLVRELVSGMTDRGRRLAGRCLPYGEGITFWPLAEIVKQAAGEDVRAGTAQLLAGDEHAGLVAERIAAAVGQAGNSGAGEETFWAVRRFFETLARDRALVVVIDDVHWAEPTFLDLVEYLHGFSEAAILLVCIARPELLDLRPTWAAPRANAVSLLLEPLAQTDSERLIDQLAAGAQAGPAVRRQVLAAAEGNPLFLEQLLAMQAEVGGELVVPPTIQALLATRIDRLEPDERAVIERASVEGRFFHRGAVAELAPEHGRQAVSGCLLALVRKQLIRPGRSEFPGDDGFRFGHILIRDAAYGAMPKHLRAELHERFARWLERRAGERVREYEEILGYHLEQAYRYRAELGALDEHARLLAAAAGHRLGAAAQRALARDDAPAAVNLFGRACSLLPADEPGRPGLLIPFGRALVHTGEVERAAAVLQQGVDSAVAQGDTRLEQHARIELAVLHAWPADSEAAWQALQETVIAAESVFERLGDDAGLARVWMWRAEWHNRNREAAARLAALERARAHARAAGDEALEAGLLDYLPAAISTALLPVAEGIRRLEDAASQAASRGPVAEANARMLLARLLARGGDIDRARRLLDDGTTVFERFGLTWMLARHTEGVGEVAMLAGDPAAAEETCRWGYETLRAMGDIGRSDCLGELLASALYAQGRYEEAEQMAASVLASDPKAVVARAVQAKALARRGMLDESARACLEATELARTMDQSGREDALADVAEALCLAGRENEAAPLIEEALALCEALGYTVLADKLRARLAALPT